MVGRHMSLPTGQNLYLSLVFLTTVVTGYSDQKGGVKATLTSHQAACRDVSKIRAVGIRQIGADRYLPVVFDEVAHSR